MYRMLMLQFIQNIMPFLTWDKFSFHKCNAKVTVDEMQYKV